MQKNVTLTPCRNVTLTPCRKKLGGSKCRNMGDMDIYACLARALARVIYLLVSVWQYKFA